MKRFAEEKHIMRRRRAVGELSYDKGSRYLELGRLRKKHPFDCGNPKCGTCSLEKRFGHRETRQEAASRIQMEEDS